MQHGEAVSTGPFEDEESKALYESLPDIRALVPALLLGATSDQQEAEPEPDQAAPDAPQSDDAKADAAPTGGHDVNAEGASSFLLPQALILPPSCALHDEPVSAS